jgi:hypothetical protein
MTAPNTIEAPDLVPVAAADACDVCGHPSAGHDRIAARFCEATQQNALSRGCICPAS